MLYVKFLLSYYEEIYAIAVYALYLQTKNKLGIKFGPLKSQI